ncbi:hypothetical protein [Microbulbifer halophilus]|uniref:hypothetical protein n=1 Tax=Microbulbifer halophilus TaxID=453963 RepID=UPI003622E04D
MDTDGDTISNLDEYIAGTSLTEADTDGDGINDNNEALFASNAKLPDSDGDGILDGDEDYDFDGVSNAMEVIAGTDPYQSEAFLATGIICFTILLQSPMGSPPSSFSIIWVGTA